MNALAQTRVMTLDEIFSIADNNNKTLKASRIAIDEAEQNVSVARSANLPQVDISLYGGYLGNIWLADKDYSNGHWYSTPHFQTDFSVTATEVIYAGGAISNNIKMSTLKKQLAELSYKNDVQSVHLLLSGYYLQLSQLYNAKKIYEENIELTTRLINDINERYEAGTALKNDITRYELQRQELQLGLTSTNNSIDIVNNQLITALDLSEGTIVKPDTALSDIIKAQIESDWQTWAKESPMIQMAETSVSLSQQGEKLASSGMKPSVAIMAGDKLQSPLTFEIIPENVEHSLNVWYVGVGVKYSLGSLWTDKRKLKEAKISTAKAQENLRIAHDNISTNVHAAYVKLGEAFNVYESRQTALKLANENYDVIHYRYLNGMALITDMLDASNSKLTAQLQLTNAQIAIAYNYCILKSVVGTL